MSWLTQHQDYCVPQLKLKPGSHRDAVLGIHEERLVITLRAKALDGAANKALIEFLSLTLDIPKRDIQIIKGEQSRFKTVKVNTRLDMAVFNKCRVD